MKAAGALIVALILAAPALSSAGTKANCHELVDARADLMDAAVKAGDRVETTNTDLKRVNKQLARATSDERRDELQKRRVVLTRRLELRVDAQHSVLSLLKAVEAKLAESCPAEFKRIREDGE